MKVSPRHALRAARAHTVCVAGRPARGLLRFCLVLLVLGGLCVRPASAKVSLGPVYGYTDGPDIAGTYAFHFQIIDFETISQTTTWRLPVRDPAALQNILAPDGWSYEMLTRPASGWDYLVWDSTELGFNAKGNDLDDPPFLLTFTGPSPDVEGLTGFGFESAYAGLSAPGNIFNGEYNMYFDPPTPDAPVLIPEPGAMALAAAGALALVARRRRN